MYSVVLLGGTVTAQLFHVASTYFQTDAAVVAKNQPDVHSMHIEFLHPCELMDSIVEVTPLRIGALASTIQLNLTQTDKLRVVALATSTNFDVVIGPSAKTAWTLHPPPPPVPDFKKVLDKKPDENWIPFYVKGEIFPLTERMFSLLPRQGHKVDGVVDTWAAFQTNKNMSSLHIALFTDLMASLSDTLLRNNGLYDSHAHHAMALKVAQETPGGFAVVENSLADAMKLKVFNSTTCLDMEFKKRVPADGVRFVFQRVVAKRLVGGRMGIDITICDEDMDLVCTAQQVILVLDIGRRVQGSKGSKDKGKGNKVKASL